MTTHPKQGRIIKGLTPFLALHKRTPTYAQAYRAATKACVSWLMNVSEERGKHARSVLRKAAADMSREAKMIAFACEPEADEGPFHAALKALHDRMTGGKDA